MTFRWQALDPWAAIRAMVNPVFSQNAYRFRADDGNETGASWLAAENTALTDVDLDVTQDIRLRIAVQETAGGSTNNFNLTLQYRVNGGTWTDVNGSTVAVIYRTSSFVANGTATTNQLATPTGTFRAGAFVSESESLARITFSGNDHGENEYSLQLVKADLADGDLIEFRLLGDGAVLSSYPQMPSLTVQLVTPPVTGTGSAVAPAATVAGTGEAAAAPVEGSGAAVAAAATSAGTGGTVVSGGGGATSPAAQAAGTGGLAAPVAEYHWFRRTPQTGAPFDPNADTPIAIVDHPTVTYDDEGLAPAGYDWQVFAYNGTEFSSGSAVVQAEVVGTGEVNGTGAVSAPAAQADGLGATDVAGAGDATAPAATAAGAGTVTVDGDGQAVAAAASVSGSGNLGEPSTSGDGTVTAPAAQTSGDAATVVEGSGAAAGAASTTASTAAVPVDATGQATAAAAQAAGTGTLGAEASNGSGTVVAPAAAVSGDATATVEGTGETTAPAVTVAGSGNLGEPATSGSGEVLAPAAEVSGSGAVTTGGDGAATPAAVLVAGSGQTLVLANGAVLAPAAIVAGSDQEQQPRPLAVFDEQERLPRHDDLDRPARHQTTGRPARHDEDDRPARHHETSRPRTWPTDLRPERHHTTQRPARFWQTVFEREDQPMAHITVNLGPFTTLEVPEPLYVRVHETLRDGTTAPLELHGQTPAWTAQVSVQTPGQDSSQATTRACTIVDPASLPVDEPQNFDTAEDGWVRVDWEDGDFAATGETKVQLTLDNTVLRLKSTAVYSAQVHDGPAALVGAP